MWRRIRSNERIVRLPFAAEALNETTVFCQRYPVYQGQKDDHNFACTIRQAGVARAAYSAALDTCRGTIGQVTQPRPFAIVGVACLALQLQLTLDVSLRCSSLMSTPH